MTDPPQGSGDTELVHCPRCGRPNAADNRRSLEKQRCTGCGWRLAKRKKVRRWWRAFRKDGERDHTVPVMLGGFAILLILTFFAARSLRPPELEKTPAADVAPVPPDEEIRQLVERLGQARTADEFLPLIRNPDTFSGMVRDWLAEARYPIPMGGRLVALAPPRDCLGHSVITAHATFEGRPLVQFLCVRTPAGWRLDWRSFAQRGDLSLGDFQAKLPANPVLVLAVVQRAGHYPEPYADEHRWMSLRLCDSMGEHAFFAWVSRDNAAAMALLDDLPPPAGEEGIDLARHGRRKALRVRSDWPRSPLAEVVSAEGDGWFLP